MSRDRSGTGGLGEGELDLRGLGRALSRRKWWIIGPTIFVTIIAGIVVNMLTPTYKSEARILYDARENVFLRPEAEKQTIDRSAGDPEALISQVQLVLSRELALQVIGQLKLNERPEFDPVLRGISPAKQLLVLLGISRDPLRMTAEERVLAAYYDRLSAYAVEKSRVIALEFQSADPVLAASAANVIAEGYLQLQQGLKQKQSRAASQWLAGEIDSLRIKVADAEARAEAYRARTNLFVGTNNANLSTQQLGEFNSQLASARAQRADAETRARIIRAMLRRGEPIEAAEIVNSELIRRLSEQRVTLRAQLAEQSSTLLDGHPRIKELKAQIVDLDRQLRAEAEKLVRSLENDARIAGARVEALSANLDALKRQAASTNEEEVQLRALEREAKAQRELLESYLAKFREASARESIGSAPADTLIISRAIVSNTPFFPKKLPIVLVAMLTTIVLTVGVTVSSELLGAGASEPAPAPPLRSEPAQMVGADAPTHPQLGVAIRDIQELAVRLRGEGERARRIALFGAEPAPATALAAITLGRALAKEARVVLVMLAPGSAVLTDDPSGPGIADVVRGRASFGEVITRDSLTGLHLIGPGRGEEELAVPAHASPRFAVLIDALARAYEHVLIDAGAIPERGLDALAKLAPLGVLVCPGASQPDSSAVKERLTAAGYREVFVLGPRPDHPVSLVAA